MDVGGLVNIIPDDKIILPKNTLDHTKKVRKIINFFRFPLYQDVEDSHIILFGSYNLKVQPYYADFDTINTVTINKNSKDTAKFVVKVIKKIIRKIEKKKGWFFTDCKAGLYEDGEAVHWRKEEIYKGERDGKPDFNGHIGNKKLIDAVKEHALLKIDMVCPYYDKYVEATVVYLIKCNDGYFNYNPDLLKMPRVLTSLVDDTKKQLKKGKYFKVIKRLFSILRYTQNKKYIDIIKPLLTSNISKLSSIGSDLSTLKLLLELKKPLNINFAVAELQIFKEKISNILDLDIDSESFDKLMNNIGNSLLEKDSKKAIKLLDQSINSIHEINNNEIIEYFESIRLDFFKFVSNVLNSTKL